MADGDGEGQDDVAQERRVRSAPFGGEDPVQTAADGIFDLLGGSGEGDEPAGETDEAGASGREEPAPGSDEGEPTEPEPRGEEPVEEPEGVEPGESPDEGPAEDESEASSDELPQTVEVKVDGETMEVPLEEAVAGYQRQEAFTRKTQKLAEERQALREEFRDLRSERQEYDTRLTALQQAMDAVAPEKPDASLREESPGEYARQMEAYETAQERINAIQEERQRVLQEEREAQQEQTQEMLRHEWEQLQAKVPELVDEDKQEELLTEWAQTAQHEYGFSEQELAHVTDHRLMLLLRDASRFHDLQAKADDVKNKSESKSSKKNLKPGGGGSKRRRSKKSSGVSDARKRLAKSGQLDDAAAAIADFFE